jgi:hypothetical protein
MALVRDTLGPLMEALTGNTNRIREEELFAQHGVYNLKDPGLLTIQKDLMNLLESGQIRLDNKTLRDPYQSYRNTLLHEGGHSIQYEDQEMMPRPRTNLEMEEYTQVFSGFFKAMQDLRNAKPGQVNVENIVNRAKHYYIMGLHDDPRFEGNKPTTEAQQVNSSRLRGFDRYGPGAWARLKTTDFYRSHPVAAGANDG